MKINLSRYGYRIQDNCVQCLGCPDIVDKDISNIYSYGYCQKCINSIPNYIPEEQWITYLESKYDKKNLLSM